jgi:hypothetical protein
LVCTFPIRKYWWCFFDIFFAFMMAFSHAMSLVVQKYNPYVYKQLERFAIYSAILMIVSLIIETLILLL